MTRHFCDRCKKETTGVKSGSIHGIEDANENGDGTITDHFDIVCVECYEAWRLWMVPEESGVV